MKYIKILAALTVFLELSCSIEDQLNAIRPGASWVIKSGDYSGIVWNDKVQVKPTPAEMATALSNCQNTVAPQATALAQAKADLNAKGNTPAQRIDAIVKYLGLDK